MEPDRLIIDHNNDLTFSKGNQKKKKKKKKQAKGATMWNKVNNVFRDPIWAFIRTMVGAHVGYRGEGGGALGFSGQIQVSCLVMYTGTDVTCACTLRWWDAWQTGKSRRLFETCDLWINIPPLGFPFFFCLVSLSWLNIPILPSPRRQTYLAMAMAMAKAMATFLWV